MSKVNGKRIYRDSGTDWPTQYRSLKTHYHKEKQRRIGASFTKIRHAGGDFMAPMYEKPVRLLFKDLVGQSGLKPNEILQREKVLQWFHNHYPKIKESTIQCHLTKMSTNVPSRFTTRQTLTARMTYSSESIRHGTGSSSLQTIRLPFTEATSMGTPGLRLKTC